jgi:DNA-binding SARP family transcriptional activator
LASRITGADGDATEASEPVAPESVTAESDPWGNLLGALVEAWVAEPSPVASRPRSETAEAGSEIRVAAAERAAALARRLGAGVLEALARGLHAYGLAEAGAPEARDTALGVESLARATGTPGPRMLAYAALATASPSRRAEYELLADNVRRETGLRLPSSIGRSPAVVEDPRAASGDSVSAPNDRADRTVNAPSLARSPGDGVSGAGPDSLEIRVFGAFAVEAHARPILLDRVKPRARAVLRFLAVRPGVAIHREVIQEALWPDVDGPTGGRSLHVAVSALRGLFADALDADSTRLIAREGDAYRLAVRPDQVDVGRFERDLASARAARNGGGDIGAGTAGFAAALALYRGDLLPQDGPAEWAVERREHFRREAVEAATIIAEHAIASGDLDEAIRVCRRGLELDRFHDPLWRVLIAARDQAGDQGAASRDRREYASILEGLGLSPELAASSA